MIDIFIHSSIDNFGPEPQPIFVSRYCRNTMLAAFLAFILAPDF